LGEAEQQEAIHQALEGTLPLEDDQVLTGWVVLFETQVAGERPTAGHVYGPAGMTTWRAVGLVEFCKYRSIFDLTSNEDDD
jgi:hypothetical protein